MSAYPPNTPGAEYRVYLENNQSVYEMSETEFYENKRREENRTTFQKIEDAFFEGMQKLLPQKHKAFAAYSCLAYTLVKYKVIHYMNDPTISKVVSVAAIGVLFLPHATLVDQVLVLAILSYNSMNRNL